MNGYNPLKSLAVKAKKNQGRWADDTTENFIFVIKMEK